MLVVDLLLIIIVLLLWGIYGNNKARYRFIPFVLCAVLALVSGLRYNVGVDYPAYEAIYNNYTSYEDSWLEPSWIVFIDFLHLCGFKSRMFFFVTSIMIVYGYYYGIKKLSPSICLSLLLFLVTGLYAETGNTVRQCVAQAILFAGSDAFVNKRWRQFAIHCVVAITAHVSAIIGIIIMLLCLIKFPRWLLFFLLCVSYAAGHVIMTIITNYTGPIFDAIEKYRYTEDMFNAGITTGYLKIFYNLLGAFILCFYNRLVKKREWMYILVNLVLVGIFIYNVFVTFMVANRIRLYCLPFIIVLLPYLSQILTPKSRYAVMGCILLIFMLFLFKTDINLSYNYDFDFR